MHPLSRIKMVLLAAAAVGALLVPGLAQARVHWSIGIGVPAYYGSTWGPGWGPGWGSGWGGGWYEPYPGYGSWSTWSPPVVVERQPVVVQSLPPGPAPQSFWYYCQNPAGYYPYVSVCPGGWTPVPASSPPPPPPAK
ncbi:MULTISPECIES: hypothetical protein [unclassified Thiomonas]|uniref:hypothetical protein n=1 Tax=unclassified Thiomonas TaxID=2625466 RepID=UPI000BC8696A|nr:MULTISPECIES: hypothetical protein [unclassified Thiomonas]OZB69392.1 MAG: hypothetical protein B7X30_13180 [Thiomonas sp. 13-64-67]